MGESLACPLCGPWRLGQALQVGSGTRTPGAHCGGCSHARCRQSRLAPAPLPPSCPGWRHHQKARGPTHVTVARGSAPSRRAGRVGCRSSPLCASASARPWHHLRVCRRLQLLPGRAGSCRCRKPKPQSSVQIRGGGRGCAMGWKQNSRLALFSENSAVGWPRGAGWGEGQPGRQPPLLSQLPEASEGRLRRSPWKPAPAALMRTRQLPRCPLSPSEPASVLIKMVKPALQPGPAPPRSL